MMVLPNNDIFVELCAFFSKYFSPKYDELQYISSTHDFHVFHVCGFSCSHTKSETGWRIDERRFFFLVLTRTVLHHSALFALAWHWKMWLCVWLVETRLNKNLFAKSMDSDNQVNIQCVIRPTFVHLIIYLNSLL